MIEGKYMVVEPGGKFNLLQISSRTELKEIVGANCLDSMTYVIGKTRYRIYVDDTGGLDNKKPSFFYRTKYDNDVNALPGTAVITNDDSDEKILPLTEANISELFDYLGTIDLKDGTKSVMTKEDYNFIGGKL